MLTFIFLYVASYLSLYHFVPFLSSPLYEADKSVQLLRHLILLYGSSHLASFLWRQKWVPKSRLNPEGMAVLVTGCDTGFGNLLARKLDKSGFKVFACCLFPDKNDAKKLKSECSSKLQIVKLDVTSDREVDQAYDVVANELMKTGDQLLAVVNNAGIMATGEVEFGSYIEPFERQIEVNCLGTIRVTKAFCPLLRRCTKSSPRLVNVTSLAARVSLPGMVGYCASKCAALSFTDGIRIELQKWNIKVISIEPHLFRTNLIAMDAQHKALQKLWDTSKPLTRKDYGESFFEGAKRLLDHGIGTARTNIPDVVDAMYDSIILKSPESHKRVLSSELERIRVWFLINIIPSSLQDYLLSKGAAYITGPTAGITAKAC